MIRYQYNGFEIEVFDDYTFDTNSSDNLNNYSKIYFSNTDNDYQTSKHGIKVYIDTQEIFDCVLIGSGGTTEIHKTSTLIDGDNLLICCCNTIFCLTIPELQLKWKTKADMATCFGIYKKQDNYIIHGEIEISSLNRNGEVLWQFGGADIFVSLDEEDSFILKSDHILLKDFYGSEYRINFNGQEIK